MNKVLVRCWELESYQSGVIKPHILYITYPEDNSGHDLITCMECGEIYAVTVVKEVYIGPPLSEKIKELKCVRCGRALDGNYSYYPERYVFDGNSYSFNRPKELPDDKLSIVKEFYGIYE
ncbi:MAG: hypothetical protein KGZ88_20390 [Methylomicrobium sp.]|nr:hypothetical protein [Methylomicrobium sp.]